MMVYSSRQSHMRQQRNPSATRTVRATAIWPLNHLNTASRGRGASLLLSASRRDTLALGVTTTLLPSYGGPLPALAALDMQATECSEPVDPALAAALLAAGADAAVASGLLPAAQLQAERFALQQREFKYALAAQAGRMPALPELSDNSGGLSNRAYYNFVSYILFKVIARHVSTEEQRAALVADMGARLANELAPQELQQLAKAAAAEPSRRAPAQLVLTCLSSLLTRLSAAGYVCGHQLVWGEAPGSWPADWAKQAPLLLPLSAGAGSTEDGSGSSSSGSSSSDSSSSSGSSSSAFAQDDDDQQQQQDQQQHAPLPPGWTFQVKLLRPADIEGAVALRAEEAGWWPRQLSALMGALLAAAGYPGAAADEYFAQDGWSGPEGGVGRLLLLLGDPLQQVDVPWTPTTLVQDWSVM